MECTMVGVKAMKLSNYFYQFRGTDAGVLKSLKIRSQALSPFPQTYVL
jgi:hypothetical protein